MVLNKEYEIGKIEVDTNDTRTLYFKKFESTIPSGADPFAIDVPSGTDAVKLVNYVVKYNDTNLIPMRTGASNYLAFCPDVSSNVRIGIKRDSSGAWAGNALTVYAWYYKSS